MSNEKPNLDDLKLSDELLEMRTKLAKEYSVGEGGVIPADKETLSKAISAEQLATLQEAQKIMHNVASASALALMDVGIPYMKKHKDVNTVELRLPVVKDVLEQSIDRSKTYPGRGEGAEAVTKWGVLNTSLLTNGATNSRGTLKKIRVFANQFAAAEFAK